MTKPNHAIPGRGFLTAAIVLVVIQVALFVISIPGYKIGVDEAWLGEQAYYLATEGTVRSEMPVSAEHEQTHLVVYHKLHVWLGAAVIKMVGLNLAAMRLITILAGAILLWLVYKYLAIDRKKTWSVYLIFLSILWCTPIFFERLHYYRPEMLVAAFGFASYYFLSKFLRTNKLRALILSGILAGVATLGHLNGVIFILSGAGLLIWKTRWKGLALFLVGSTLSSMFYMVDSVSDLSQLFYQFTHSQGEQVRDLGLSSPIMNLLSEHKRLFRSPEIASISCLMVLALVDLFRRHRFWKNPINFYTILLVIFIGLTGHNKTAKYGVLLFPFFAIVITSFVGRLFRRDQRTTAWFRYLASAMLITHLMIGLGYNSYHTVAGREKAEARHSQVARVLRPGSTVVAPMKFMYNEIERFDIRGFVGIRLELDEHGSEMTFDMMKSKAYNFGIEHILLDTKFDNVWYPIFLSESVQNGQHYQIEDTVAGYLILTRLNNTINTQ